MINWNIHFWNLNICGDERKLLLDVLLWTFKVLLIRKKAQKELEDYYEAELDWKRKFEAKKK